MVRALAITMSSSFRESLFKAQVPSHVVHCLSNAIEYSCCNYAAFTYARYLEEAIRIFGISGVKSTVKSMLSNMNDWKSEKGLSNKKILRAWCDEPDQPIIAHCVVEREEETQ
jgi:hypothetical protein